MSRKAKMIEREKTLGFQSRNRQEPGFLRPSKELPFQSHNDGYWRPIVTKKAESKKS